MARQVRYKLLIDWDRNGTFTDESSYLISASGNMSYAPLTKTVLDGRGVVDTMSLTLRNNDGRFSSLNSSGPLYAYLGNGGGYRAPVRFEVSIDGGANYVRIFTGVAKAPTERTATPRGIRQVTLLCRSREELLLQARASTPLANLVAHNGAAYTEADYIQAWLTQLGFTSGDWALDPGIQVIPWAWLDDESPLEDIWMLAAAAGGRFYADPEGVFRYENAAHYLGSEHTTPALALTRGDFVDFTVEWPDQELFNQVTVETSPRAQGAVAVIWTPEEPIVVPAGEATTVTARFRQPVAAITALAWRAKSAASEDITSSVTLTTPNYYAQRVLLTWTNAHADRAAYLYGVELSGAPLIGSPSQEVTVTSSALPGGYTLADLRVKSLRNNPYVQSRAQARSLAQFLLDQYVAPRAQLTVSGVPGRPALRLGQRVTVTDALMASASRAMLLTRIDWQAGQAGFVQNLQGQDVTGGLYPQSSYFVIGTDALNSAKPIFY